MPVLNLEKTLQHPSNKILDVLSDIDQHQNFFPVCKTSTVESRETLSNGTDRGTAKYVFEILRYGISEEAIIQFDLDKPGQCLKFTTWDKDDASLKAEIVYEFLDEGPDCSLVKVQISYDKSSKRFFWVAVKPIIRRFFHKFIDLVDNRIKALDALKNDPSAASNTSNQPITMIRAFHQFDERSYAARVEILKRLPAISVGAEVGTYMGAFAQMILEQLNPKKLILIDSWVGLQGESQAGSWYETVDQNYMDEIYEMVRQRFSTEVADGTVEIIRDFSTTAFLGITDGQLDWTYIDGDHSYEAVREDLRLSFAKVRNGGFISGDDYVVGDHWWKDNVVRAVTEFVEANPVDLVWENDGQFLLQKH